MTPFLHHKGSIFYAEAFVINAMVASHW